MLCTANKGNISYMLCTANKGNCTELVCYISVTVDATFALSKNVMVPEKTFTRASHFMHP